MSRKFIENRFDIVHPNQKYLIMKRRSYSRRRFRGSRRRSSRYIKAPFRGLRHF